MPVNYKPQATKRSSWSMGGTERGGRTTRGCARVAAADWGVRFLATRDSTVDRHSDALLARTVTSDTRAGQSI